MFVCANAHKIIYVVWLRIECLVLHHLNTLFATLRGKYFDWTMSEPSLYPKFTVNELGFARSDDNFRASMKFTLDLVHHVQETGPIGSDHYIRASIVPAWNAGLKKVQTYTACILHHFRLRLPRFLQVLSCFSGHFKR